MVISYCAFKTKSNTILKSVVSQVTPGKVMKDRFGEKLGTGTQVHIGQPSASPQTFSASQHRLMAASNCEAFQGTRKHVPLSKFTMFKPSCLLAESVLHALWYSWLFQTWPQWFLTWGPCTLQHSEIIIGLLDYIQYFKNQWFFSVRLWLLTMESPFWWGGRE